MVRHSTTLRYILLAVSTNCVGIWGTHGDMMIIYTVLMINRWNLKGRIPSRGLKLWSAFPGCVRKRIFEAWSYTGRKQRKNQAKCARGWVLALTLDFPVEVPGFGSRKVKIPQQGIASGFNAAYAGLIQSMYRHWLLAVFKRNISDRHSTMCTRNRQKEPGSVQFILLNVLRC